MNGGITLNLTRLGWSTTHEREFESFREEGLTVGRVAAEHKGFYELYTDNGLVKAVVTGKMKHEARHRGDLPAVGDWVVLNSDTSIDSLVRIQAILSRSSRFSRKEAGFATEEQIIAANVDTLFLVTALDGNFNIRRIERMLVAAWGSGASPVIVLTKSDLCDSVDQKIEEVKEVALRVPVHAVSSLSEEGLEQLTPYLREGKTTVLLGSSGVGKSSLINHFMRKTVQTVNSVRCGDDRGRHTTTYRQLLLLPDGGMIIDTPGMRELQLWDGSEAFDNTFSDIEELSGQCKFRNCSHHQEPGCAVQGAIQAGRLTLTRLKNYEKLQREWQRVEEKKKRQESVKGKGKYSRLTKHGRQA